MKIAILGDTHFGCRNDVKVFHDYFKRFYSEVFIPRLLEENVKHVFQLGDLFDRRKYINFYSLAECKKYFFDLLDMHGITLHTLVGNHDIYWRESVEVNSTSLVLGEYSNVSIYTSPQTVFLEDGTTIDMIPWICAENEKDVFNFIDNSKSDICFGHFEIAGFSMYRGMESHDGISTDMFQKYEMVCSGHYHTKSKKENIIYVGTPAEMTWQDFNDPKGFHLFDLESREMEFVQNPYTMFVRLEYDDTKEMSPLGAYDLTDAYVKLVVVNKTDYYKFDQYVNTLYNKGCYEIKIIEDLSEFSDGEIGEEINLEDTVSVLSHFIDSVETDADREKVKVFMKTLYNEAVNVEV